MACILCHAEQYSVILQRVEHAQQELGIGMPTHSSLLEDTPSVDGMYILYTQNGWCIAYTEHAESMQKWSILCTYRRVEHAEY
jgi:hypothetical protein